MKALAVVLKLQVENHHLSCCSSLARSVPVFMCVRVCPPPNIRTRLICLEMTHLPRIVGQSMRLGLKTPGPSRLWERHLANESRASRSADVSTVEPLYIEYYSSPYTVSNDGSHAVIVTRTVNVEHNI
jgi:hypothetical protein